MPATKPAWYRSLLAASEKLHWPMPVDYTSASREDRAAFEEAFLNLLKFQKMSVLISSDYVSMTILLIIQW
jgi:hypothetical protein